ncbi:MAG: prepilin-type N-terminal cleavage/methylation domain-containing protein [Candidatus Omnitrophica bacterium]|nr:prepilin-type N-terminal cleavage/methylation domain-containing protein [Candidatus Omnitrophota bacterium]
MNKKAFTILEILVVISIVTILVGFGLVRFKGMQDEANILKMRAELRTIQAAVESYKNSMGVYPDSVTTLEGARPRIIESGLKNAYLPTLDYEIARSTDGSTYYVVYGLLDSEATVSISDADGEVTESAATDSLCVTNGFNCD